MRFRLSVFPFALVCALAAAPVFAQSAPSSLPDWEQLTPQQRETLIAPVRERWNDNPGQRTRMLDRAQRWHQMTPEERQHAHRGIKRWKRMNPEQQQQMRAFYERTRHLTPEQREAEREKLKAMTPAQRSEWFERTPPPPTP